MTGHDSERSVLLVEGKADQHAIEHLLGQHDVRYRQKAKLPRPLPLPRAPNGGKDDLLALVGVSVQSSTGRSAGFVMDANSRPEGRWKSISSRLRRVDVDVPDQIPVSGFVGESPKYRTRVGVWLMPNNQRTGVLEHFLASLVEDGNRLFAHASQILHEHSNEAGCRVCAKRCAESDDSRLVGVARKARPALRSCNPSEVLPS